MNRAAVVVGLLTACLIGLALRLPRLAQRPMHTDEAVHAVKCDELRRTGAYHYDPHDYHGPTLYYFTFPAFWLTGTPDFASTTETTYRLVPVCFGVGLILLLALVVDGLGRFATVVAGILTAVSPGFVYYSRYYIQETLLVFFTFLVLAAVWRYWQNRRVAWALLAGVGIGLMHATKETCVLAWGVMAIAGTLTWLWDRHQPRSMRGHGAALFAMRPALSRQGGHIGGVMASSALALLAAAAVSIACFSVFFTNLRGPVDSLLALSRYVARADSGLHTHPWNFYLQTLLWTHYPPTPVFTEALIVGLALVGAGGALLARGIPAPRVPLARALTLYAILLTGAYSVIPYKTPWCALGFLHALILLAGVGASVLFAVIRHRLPQFMLALLLLAGTAHLGRQAWLAATTYAADNRNPYAYAHPLPDVVNLGTWAEKLAAVHPDGPAMLTKVIAPHAWPLPWYLRGLSRVGYWEAPPENADAPLVITAQQFLPELEALWHSRYRISYYGLRPNESLAACVDETLWNAFVAREGHSTPPNSGKR